MSGASSGGLDTENKRVALLIAVLALFLALSEMGGKQAQNEALSSNIEASNLWSFFQAKTIRRTSVQTASQLLQTQASTTSDPAVKAAFEKQIAEWKTLADRYESEPETQEGRKELVRRAKEKEATRDLASAKDTKFEIASGSFQLAIVLASAAIITGLGLLVWLAAGFGLIGIGMISLAFLAPTALF
jgi:hypothetical protein